MADKKPRMGDPLEVFEGPDGRKLWGKLCDHLGIDPKGAQYPLGTGTQGAVYELEDGRAFKLTWDEQEAKASALVARTPDPKGNVVRIESVVKVANNVSHMAVWAIAMEKLQRMPDSDPFASFAGAWNLFSSENERRAVLPMNIDDFFNSTREYHFADTSHPEWKEFQTWIADVAAYLRQIGVIFHDLWAGNVMLRGSQHVLIDLGYSRSTKDARIDVVSKLIALAKEIESLS